MRMTKRANGVWLVDYTDDAGNRKRVSTGTRDKVDAEQIAARIIAGTHVRAPTGTGVTLAVALHHTFETHWQHLKSAHTFAIHVRNLGRDHGHVQVKDVDYPLMLEWVRVWRAEGSTNGTINRRLAAVSKALTEAAKMGWIVAAPPVPRQKEKATKFRWVNPVEEKRLLDATRNVFGDGIGVNMRSLIRFLLATGCRLGEALKLTDADVSSNPMQVTFHDTKNGSTRTVPITGDTLAVARRVASLNWTGDQAVHRFTKVRDRAGMPDVSLHTLRHTTASRLVQAGIDLYVVSQWLGHSSITVTQRYAHLAPSNLRHAAEALAQAGTVPSDMAHLRVVGRG